MLLVLITCSFVAIIKASVVLFKHPFLSHSHQSSLALPVVCLIICPCNCFCVHSVFPSVFFLYLYSFVVSLHRLLLFLQQLTICLCCFLHNFLIPNLLSLQYLGFQSIPCCLHFLIVTISLH